MVARRLAIAATSNACDRSLASFLSQVLSPRQHHVGCRRQVRTGKLYQTGREVLWWLEVAPDVPLDRTYTTEPAQDGERTVVLRRVGNTQLIDLAYHVPSGGDRDYAAIEMLAYVYGAEPSGRLYKDLVLTEMVSSVNAYSMALHDPGLIMFGVQVSKEKSLEDARQALINSVEGVAEKAITTDELNRARGRNF